MSIKMTRFLVLIFCAVLILPGCAQKWSVVMDTEITSIGWPRLPDEPSVEHISTVSGFKEAGTSFLEVIHSAVFGRSQEGKLLQPVAITKGRDGRYAIADIGAKAVHLYLPGEQRYVAIRDAGKGELVTPVGVVFDDELKLYVSDSALGKVFVYDRAGTFIFSINETRLGHLKRPTGLAYNIVRSLLYVVDTAENTVFAFKTDGTEAFSFGKRGTGKGQFNFPTHIFSSEAGYLLVNDAMNFRVQIFDPSGEFLSLFGHHGDGTGDFAMPKGIAADKNGIIYVVDALFDNIQLFSREGKFLLTVGDPGKGRGEFWLPSGLFIDGDMIYVCDTFNQRVQILRINISDNDKIK